MGQDKPYIFISHASKDNARIRPVIVALLAGGTPLWIDKPEGPGLEFDRTEFAGCLKFGEKWSEKVLDAIAASAGMIVFPSEAAGKSGEVMREVGFAQSEEKTRPAFFCLNSVLLSREDGAYEAAVTRGKHSCSAFVEESAPGVFILTPDGNASLKILIQQLKAHIANVGSGCPPAEVIVDPGADYDIPYRADRLPQFYAARGCFDANVACPPVFVSHGEADQLPGRFTSVTFPKRLIPLNPAFRFQGATLSVIRLSWPDGSVVDTNDIRLSLFQDLLKALQASSSISLAKWTSVSGVAEAIGKALTADNTTRIISVQVEVDVENHKSLSEKIDLWTGLWDEFISAQTEVRSHFLFVPILELVYAPPKTFLAKFFRSTGARCATDPASIGRTVAKTYSNVRLTTLPELSGVTRSCVREWIADDELFKSRGQDWRDDMTQKLTRLVPEGTSPGKGLAMRRWAELSTPVLRAEKVR